MSTRLGRQPARAATALLALAAASCGGSPPEGRTAPDPGGGTAAVTLGTLDDVFLLTGEIEALSAVQFAAPQIAGDPRIQWLAEDGAAVKAGDPVVAFDSAALLGALEDKRLKAAQAAIDLENRRHTTAADIESKRAAVERADVERRQAELRAAVPAELQARRDWQEKQAALERARAALEKARLEARAAEAAARADVEGARAALEKARRDLDGSERALRQFEMRAPRDGIFLVHDHWRWNEARKLQAGDSVFLGYPVASLPDLGELRVRARLAEVDAGRVEAGQAARCILDTYPDRAYACRVKDVASVAETRQGGSGFKVHVALDASDPERMRPGMSVRVEVLRRRFEQALLVPRGAVERRDGRAFVERAEGGRAEVQLAACTPTQCAVASGLHEGDRVALP